MQSPAERAIVFERIRAAVLEEATRPSPYDAKQHDKNKAEFTKALDDVCRNAHLRADMSVDDLWGRVWKTIRYAGFKAEYVHGEIEQLTPFFKDFRVLAGPEWYFDSDKKAHGKAVREFLNKEGRFAGISYSRLAPKLHKILSVAAVFQVFQPDALPLASFLGDGYDVPGDAALWRVHKRLAQLVGYTTALHLMMGIGFNCVKPDIWLVRLMCRLGWIENALPVNSADAVIRKVYQKSRRQCTHYTRKLL
jgi:hypothetical protein